MNVTRWPAWLLAILLITAATPANRAFARGDERDKDRPDLKKLVEQVARGDDEAAAEAGDELIEKVLGPVTAALGAVETRPPNEQRRIRKLLGRLSAALRVRLMRADLGPEDRKLLDEFVAHNPELVERLFDDSVDSRLEALDRLPLDANSGAGVLLVAKINDPDAEVAESATRLAMRLKDAVVVRGLTRYVKDATEAIRTGHFGPGDQAAAAMCALLVQRCIEALGEARAQESTLVIVDSLRVLARSPYRSPEFFDVAKVAEALAKIGDERAAPALLELTNDHALYLSQPLVPRGMATLSVGDAVLLSLVRLYGLDPASMGFYVAPAPASFIGFVDDKSREATHREFARWHKDNADKPADQRTKPPPRKPASAPVTPAPVTDDD